MAKGKRNKTTKRAGSDKPKPKLDTPSPDSPLYLTKNVPAIHKEVVKIDKHKREILHELWPELLMGNVSHAESAIWRSIGTYKAGLTPQEVEALKEIRQNLRRELDQLNIIYFRLKFWS